jgi:energy-coupling factor transporter transmembrane protein EcfT
LPDVVASAGPLAALDILAQREGITPLRPVHRNASAAMAWGMTSLIFCWLVPIGIVTGILSVFFATRGLRAIRSQPDRFQGADKAKTGRLLGWIGLVVSSLIALLIAIGFIFRS